ncbi:hypothetical protein C8Q78DRAFT_678158 [Trametes maxima]|nr:hypothetical protein C8Q78DRAFT_678158 [Trametes maxima]
MEDEKINRQQPHTNDTLFTAFNPLLRRGEGCFGSPEVEDTKLQSRAPLTKALDCPVPSRRVQQCGALSTSVLTVPVVDTRYLSAYTKGTHLKVPTRASILISPRLHRYSFLLRSGATVPPSILLFQFLVTCMSSRGVVLTWMDGGDGLCGPRVFLRPSAFLEAHTRRVRSRSYLEVPVVVADAVGSTSQGSRILPKVARSTR